MPNMSAAIGLSSLNDIGKSLKKKEKMANFYSSRLKKIPGLILPIESVNCKRVYWMYTVLVKEKEFGMSKDQLSELLLQKYKIQTRSFFYSPEVAFKSMGKFQGDSFPVAKMISEEGLYLPSGLGNKADDFKLVVKAIEEVATNH